MIKSIKGVVKRGNMLGQKLGFPTANIDVDPLININRGVYIVEFVVDGYTYHGVSNIGVHPTVGSMSAPQIEVHILDYNGDLYDKVATVVLRKRLREERHFKDSDELVKAIESDVQMARDYFGMK